MDDNTPLWFGEHKGKTLANVPASYLLWWDRSNEAPTYEKGRQLKQYIENNRQMLLQEAIITKR